jgi:hypothetical protein
MHGENLRKFMETRAAAPHLAHIVWMALLYFQIKALPGTF